MKNGKIIGSVIFVSILLVISFMACDSGGGTPDPCAGGHTYENHICSVCGADARAAYFGTFKVPLPSVAMVTIEANRLERDPYVLVNLTWELITNNDASSQADFPTGYKITGTIDSLSSVYDTLGKVGEQGTDAWYLHTDGNSIRWSIWSNNFAINNGSTYIREP